MIKRCKDLDVWNNAPELVENTYKITPSFPDEEKYGLTSQIRRSSVSVPSNIAKSFMRNSYKEYIRFLYIALGSLGELDTQVELSSRLSFINDSRELENRIKIIRMQLFGLKKSLKNRII